MINIISTFWTKFDNNYYRIKDGVLKQAPINTDGSVSIENKVEVVSIEEDILKNINNEFGSKFDINNFN